MIKPITVGEIKRKGFAPEVEKVLGNIAFNDGSPGAIDTIEEYRQAVAILEFFSSLKNGVCEYEDVNGLKESMAKSYIASKYNLSSVGVDDLFNTNKALYHSGLVYLALGNKLDVFSFALNDASENSFSSDPIKKLLSYANSVFILTDSGSFYRSRGLGVGRAPFDRVGCRSSLVVKEMLIDKSGRLYIQTTSNEIGVVSEDGIARRVCFDEEIDLEGALTLYNGYVAVLNEETVGDSITYTALPVNSPNQLRSFYGYCPRH